MADYIIFEKQRGQREFSGTSSEPLDDDGLLEWLTEHTNVRVPGADDRPVERLLGRIRAGGINVRVRPWGELRLGPHDECLILRLEDNHICGRLIKMLPISHFVKSA